MVHSLFPAGQLLLLAAIASAAEVSQSLAGHVKARTVLERYPADSVMRELTGPDAADAAAELRLKWQLDRNAWSMQADWQLFGRYGDLTEAVRRLPGPGVDPAAVVPDDARRLFDLSASLEDAGKRAAGHRLDRLWIGYTGANTVVRFGRQALTWGNGLFFAPLDIVNPFDPSAVDTEYKNGDDMLYAQLLLPSGNDIEFAWVLRRDPATRSADPDAATIAARYNAIAGDAEYQVLAGRSHGTTILGAGGSRSVGGAVWRADLSLENEDGWTARFVTNVGYSWRWFEHNVAGSVEYFYNGYGLPAGRYDAAVVAADPDLSARLARGDLYTLGRHYVAGGLNVELTPLWQLQPVVLWNLDDGSALLQAVVQHSLGDNLALVAALDLPLGPAGSEYGGIASGVDELTLGRDARLFVQLAWYF